jgi:hypothetical protein
MALVVAGASGAAMALVVAGPAPATMAAGATMAPVTILPVVGGGRSAVVSIPAVPV